MEKWGAKDYKSRLALGVKLLEGKMKLLLLIVQKYMVSYRGEFEHPLISCSCELFMHPISYKCGKVIYGCRRLSWGIDGHESKDNFINVLTCGIT